MTALGISNPITNISPTATALLGYYPLPNSNTGGYNYENFQSTPARTDGADARLDQVINAKQSIYVRLSRKNITQDFATPLLPNDSDSVHNRSFLVSHTYTITPKLLNEFRFGFTNVTTNVGFPISGASALQQLNLTGVDISQHPTTNAFPTFNFSAGTGFKHCVQQSFNAYSPTSGAACTKYLTASQAGLPQGFAIDLQKECAAAILFCLRALQRYKDSCARRFWRLYVDQPGSALV